MAPTKWRSVGGKNPCNPPRRVRPPTARELDTAWGNVFAAARCWLILERLARVRGRHGTGASCPSCNLAREAATPPLATRLGPSRGVDPVGETAILLSPSWPTPAVFAPLLER